jgi:hypothetical protein
MSAGPPRSESVGGDSVGNWLDDSPHNTVKGRYHNTPFSPLEAFR